MTRETGCHAFADAADQSRPDRPHRSGKVELLEKIAAFGSIAAAGRAMDMSYRRAWELVEDLNSIFGKPVVERQTGGRRGGGARLTSLGLALVTRFRAVERAATDAAKDHLVALQREVAALEPSTATQTDIEEN